MFNVSKVSLQNDEFKIQGQIVVSDYITSPIFNDSLTAYVFELRTSVFSFIVFFFPCSFYFI